MSKLDWVGLVVLVTLNPYLVVGETSVTVYNRNFAIIRETIKLQLQADVTEVRQGPVADYAEPNSVILRDVSGANAFTVIEQSFVNSGLTQAGMLAAFEGQTIDFYRSDHGKSEIIQGKIIRAGQPKIVGQEDRYVAPIVEVAGKRQFELPGVPRFPVSGRAAEIQPQFIWKISTSMPSIGTPTTT
jgi:hypothetical protein